MLDEMTAPAARSNRNVRPTPSKTQIGQIVFTVPLRVLSGLRWLTWVVAGSNLASSVLGLDYLPTFSWWWVALGWVLLVSAPGRMALSALGARILLRRVTPGDYPRGGRIHLRLWLAERLADELGAANLAGAAWMPTYARALGAKVGRSVDLHSIPPVTGHADPRQRLLGRARGRPLRPLARRRRAAHRPDQGRRRRSGRHAQHPRAGCRGRP